MSTRPIAGRPLAARQIKIGGLYRTTVESGEVMVRIVRRHEPTEASRNALFQCVDAATGKALPKMKRAEDLSL